MLISSMELQYLLGKKGIKSSFLNLNFCLYCSNLVFPRFYSKAHVSSMNFNLRGLESYSPLLKFPWIGLQLLVVLACLVAFCSISLTQAAKSDELNSSSCLFLSFSLNSFVFITNTGDNLCSGILFTYDCIQLIDYLIILFAFPLELSSAMSKF